METNKIRQLADDAIDRARRVHALVYAGDLDAAHTEISRLMWELTALREEIETAIRDAEQAAMPEPHPSMHRAAFSVSHYPALVDADRARFLAEVRAGRMVSRPGEDARSTQVVTMVAVSEQERRAAGGR